MLSQALVLCGGLGTRLGELTASTPKPMLPVAGRPFLEHLLQEIAR
ncbi:MAG: NTP transferase domain-containing protein, partial [Hyphomicrobium sp.]|nr:NTP transferase domain-containing protein [Hyphomicrobium sp.]